MFVKRMSPILSTYRRHSFCLSSRELRKVYQRNQCKVYSSIDTRCIMHTVFIKRISSTFANTTVLAFWSKMEKTLA